MAMQTEESTEGSDDPDLVQGSGHATSESAVSPDVGRGGVWLSWPRLVALVAAFAFLASAVVYVVDSRESQPGAVDVGFYQDMTVHHEQAIELSMIELAVGEDPAASTFAKEILMFQSREIGIMATRLEDWGASGDRPPTAMAWMDMSIPVSEMPGMATEEQVDALGAAEGRDADALFLDLMAEHHRGGIHMASYAATHAENAEVRELAGRMARLQATEVNEMAQTAERLGLDIEIEPVDVPAQP